MNFKEIRLIGFKSFADKTCVRLDDGVTCIVGPNGCGKSTLLRTANGLLPKTGGEGVQGYLVGGAVLVVLAAFGLGWYYRRKHTVRT